MRTIGVIIVLICLKVAVHAQADYFKIRNYKTDAVLSINQNTASSLILSDYGAIRFQKGNENSKYLFQGQEFDTDLGLYIFPSRLYSVKEKRFFQPDPKSQYHSPYLFVGADPINMVDWDGNMGKPLVLHAIEKGKPLPTPVAKENRYSYTLTDFMDNKIPDLPEWDGNVYVHAHMGADGKMTIEDNDGSGTFQSQNLLDNNVATKYEEKATQRGASNAVDKIEIEMDGEKFGDQLKRFSAKQNIKVKNVVMAGCEGEAVAESAADGFEYSLADHPFGDSPEVNFFGTKKGYWMRDFEMKGQKTWSWLPNDATITPFNMDKVIDGKTVKIPGHIPKGKKDILPDYGNPTENVGEDLLFHGRIPPTAQNFVSRIPGGY